MSNAETVGERLKRLREGAEPKLSIRAIAELLGLSSSSYNHYETNYKKPYLPLPFTRQLVSILGDRGVDKGEILALAGVTPSGVPANEPEQMAAQLDAVLLPEIDVAYSMGGGADISDFPVIQMVPMSRSWLRGLTDSATADLFVARGDGDSMMPTLLDQDIVIIDRSQRRISRQDRVWALTYGGFGMIKRVRGLPNGTLQINSDNAAVSPIIATEEECHVVGRVVGVIRRI